jgi:hypothetical protein
MSVVSFEEEKIRRDSNLYRRLLASATLKLFGQQHGRRPKSVDELLQWKAQQGEIDPFTALTEKEVEELKREK